MTTEARDRALLTHGGQRYGTSPYVAHLDEVAAVLRDYAYGWNLPMLQAAYLHDALEDAPTSVIAAHRRACILRDNGPDVLFIVQCCTDEPGPNRTTRKAATYRRWPAIRRAASRDAATAAMVKDAHRVKLADRVANLRASHRSSSHHLAMYRAEAPAFRAALYVPGIADALWAEHDRLVGGDL